MANFLYALGRSAFLRGEIDWESDTITVALLDSTYTADADVDEFADDLTGVLATATLANCVVLPDGIADADDVSVAGVGIGEVVERVVFYKNTGVAATSRLIYYADENDDTTAIYREGDGGNIVLMFSNAATRCFRM